MSFELSTQDVPEIERRALLQQSSSSSATVLSQSSNQGKANESQESSSSSSSSSSEFTSQEILMYAELEKEAVEKISAYYAERASMEAKAGAEAADEQATWARQSESPMAPQPIPESPAKRTVTCSKCGVKGHNKLYCGKAAIQSSKSSSVDTPSPRKSKHAAGAIDALFVAEDVEGVGRLDFDFLAGDLAAPMEGVEQQPQKREPTMQDFRLCACAGNCEDKKCSCRKADRACNPRYCRCCTGYEPLCGNCETVPAHFAKSTTDPLPEICPLHFGAAGEGEIEEEGALIIACWNVRSFGHNMFNEPPDGRPKILSQPFKALIAKLVEFITHHDLDLLFIQETMDAAALLYLVDQLNNCYKLEWLPTLVDIGLGFNLSDPKVRPVEMAAVVYKDLSKHSPTPPWVLCQQLALSEHVITGQHEAITEMRDRFKRLPAYLTVEFANREIIAFVTMHLPCDSGTQTLRLTAEIASLPDLAASVKQTTGADHVILLGDFNRNPNTVAFAPLTKTHWPSILPNPGVRTNTGKTAHVYDNFFLPHALWPRARAAVGAEEWMNLALQRGPSRLTSDHYPILLALNPPATTEA